MTRHKGLRRKIHIQRVNGMQLLPEGEAKSVHLAVWPAFPVMPEKTQQPALKRLLQLGGLHISTDLSYRLLQLPAA
ncbi:hypothetical protein D3C71_2071840 [compost metagenome]